MIVEPKKPSKPKLRLQGRTIITTKTFLYYCYTTDTLESITLNETATTIFFFTKLLTKLLDSPTLASDPPSGPLPPGFRRLQRNDTLQNNDQWKQNLLRETGSLAPLWTACAIAGQAPALTLPRPREPLKPSEPSIMEERRREYRTALALRLGVPEAEVPETSPTLI